jgi:SAM-dependent methyltransferase
VTDLLVTTLGWPATVLHGDPCAFDRWRWLRRHIQRGDYCTLDAGCGSGAFTMYAAKLGNEALGLSFDSRQLQAASRRANRLGIPAKFLRADLRDFDGLPGKVGPFDCIFCLEVIEHIRNDRKLLVDLVTLLKPGGRLLLTTPYKHAYPFVGDRLSPTEDGGHVRWGYTHEEMIRLFRDCGLQVESTGYVSGMVSQQITNLIRILGRFSYPMAWVLTFPLRILQVADRPLTRLVGYPFVTIAIIGLKTAEAAETGA